MSRWSTPKSYGKNKESYVNLDDPYHSHTVTKAPRKERRRKTLYSALSGGSYEYTFPGMTADQTRQISSPKEARDNIHLSPRRMRIDETRDIETRDQLEPWGYDMTKETNRNDARLGSGDIRSSFNDDTRTDRVRTTSSSAIPMRSTPSISHNRNDLYSPPRLSRHSSSREELYRSSTGFKDNDKNRYPVQSHHVHQQRRAAIQRPRVPLAFQYYESIGPKSLNIHRLRLPSEYLHLLDKSKCR